MRTRDCLFPKFRSTGRKVAAPHRTLLRDFNPRYLIRHLARKSAPPMRISLISLPKHMKSSVIENSVVRMPKRK
jgi:hypothetical protein